MLNIEPRLDFLQGTIVAATGATTIVPAVAGWQIAVYQVTLTVDTGPTILRSSVPTTIRGFVSPGAGTIETHEWDLGALDVPLHVLRSGFALQLDNTLNAATCRWTCHFIYRRGTT